MSFYSQFQKYSIPVLENGVKLPDFKIEKKFIEKYSLPDNCDHYQFLLALCIDGLNKRIGRDNPRYKEYYARMKVELGVLKDLGFCAYLLITWDVINYCRENDIAIGYGRGSAGNSLVLYLVGVTEIDSLKYGLYFERFLNKTRAKYKEVDGVRYYQGDLLMDVDLDISDVDRDRLVEWMNEKYKGKIAKLPTSGTYTTKVLIKEVSKSYLEVEETEANRVSETIPVEFGKPKPIDAACEESEEFKKFCDENPEVVKISKRLYELNKYDGIHASAWIITADDINDVFPLQRSSKGELCSVYTMEDSSNLSIKVDILGLKCASVIEKTCKRVGIDPLKIPQDPKVYEFLQNIQTPKGLFQVEGDCNYRVLKQVKPQKIEHLAAIVALARPGVLQFVDVFAKYVETGEFQSVHPFFDDILKDTAGIPLYQESLLKMANKVGFTLSESETLRRIIGKKKVEEMVEWEQKLKDKIKENNLDPAIGDILWKIMDDSKNYSFNAGHANAYGLMSYATAYLKYYHPQEFFLSLLQLSKGKDGTKNSADEIGLIQGELNRFGIKLLGPDIIKSDIDFKIEGADIRFGLGYVKGVAKKSFEELKNFQQDYPDKFSIFKSAEEAGLNIGILSALIMAGAMDAYLKESRSMAVLEAQTYKILTDKEKKKVLELGKEFNYSLFNVITHLKGVKNEKGKPFFREATEKMQSRLDTIRKGYKTYVDIYNKNSKNEKLASYFYESRLIGYSYSDDLSNILKEYYSDIQSIESAKNEIDGEAVTICGVIKEVKYGVSKEKKTKYVRIKIADSTGEMTCMLFNSKDRKGKFQERIEQMELQNGGKFKEKEEWLVVCEGQKKPDAIFCEKISRQESKVYLKLAELRADEKDEKID
jgi:DNA polymerase-3 subunit alpha